MLMINSRNDYKFFLEADKIALRVTRPLTFKDRLYYHFFNDVWKFEKLLRKTEYYQNCSKSLVSKSNFFFLKYKLYKQQIKLGFLIEPNCFGPGLSIAHPGAIIVSQRAKIGANCRIHVGVSIGANGGIDKAPIIGNNVYIGPGAKIFGDINIADGTAVGANSVVNKSFTEPNITIAGIPAIKISNKGSKGLLTNATEIINKRKE